MVESGDRYQKQLLLAGLGARGQARLGAAGVLIAGVGALGGHLAQLMVRAGVGRVRLVDRDVPELSNLHRQPLYDENDLGSGEGKAQIAAEKLRAVNSEVVIEAVVAELGPPNVLELAQGLDLILDGLDNPATRYLINDAAVHLGLPWIYTGVVATRGNVLCIVPGRTPCLRCLFPSPPPLEALPRVDTHGIIGPTPAFAAALAAAQALKLLSGGPDGLLPGLFSFDFWRGQFQLTELPGGPAPDCPCCGQRDFPFLEGRAQPA
ncbi:MAG: thiazole biosynthesis adenylyltransferase ThiF [Desulfarculus sp.]|nr:MAG: thiazole biosynthesis adenylyltransferase ThiF [Desulfarculus sp.]